MSEVLLKVDGAVEHPLALEFADMAAFPEAAQFTDVSRLNSSRRGDGVTLDAILDRAEVRPGCDVTSSCMPTVTTSTSACRLRQSWARGSLSTSWVQSL